MESVTLVEAMLLDLQQSVEQVQRLKREYDDNEVVNIGHFQKLDAFLHANPALQAENNGLHLQLIDEGESADQEDVEARLHLKRLEDEIQETNFALQESLGDSAQMELQLHTLQKACSSLLGLEWQDGPPMDISSPSLIDPHVLPAATGDVPTGEASHDLQLQALLASCQRENSSLEQKIQEERQRSRMLLEELVKEGAEIIAAGPSISVLASQAELATLKEEVDRKRPEVNDLLSENASLTEEAADLRQLRSQQSADCQQALRQLEVLQLEEQKLSQQLTHEAGQRNARLSDETSRNAQTEQEIDRLKRESIPMSAEIEEHRIELQELERHELRQSQATAELLEALRSERSKLSQENEAARKMSGAKMAALQQRVTALQESAAMSERAHVRLESEAAEAQEAARRDSDLVGERKRELAGAISLGSLLVQQRSRLEAQLGSLDAAAETLTTERKVLEEMLKEEQKRLSKERMEELTLRSSREHLGAIADAPEAARWSAVADDAMASLQKAHSELVDLEKRVATAKASRAQLEQEVRAVEKHLGTASQQHTDLEAEVREWDLEAQQEEKKVHGSKERVAAAGRELQQLQFQMKSSHEAQQVAAELAQKQHTVLADSLHRAIMEKNTLANACAMKTTLRNEEVTKSEQRLALMQGDLQTALSEHQELVRAAALADDAKQRTDKITSEVAASHRQAVTELQHLRQRCDDLRLDLRHAQQQEAEASQELASSHKELAAQEKILQTSEQAVSALYRSAAQRSKENDRLRQSELACAEDLAAGKAKVTAVTQQCDHLSSEVQELLQKVTALETNGTELSAAIRKRSIQLDACKSEFVAAESYAAERVQEYESSCAEVETLRKAVAEADASCAHLQHLASGQSADIQVLQSELADQEEVKSAAQQAAEHLQASVEEHESNLQTTTSAVAYTSEEANSLRERVRHMEAESEQSLREATNVLDDLGRMTKENQSLHEEVRVLNHKVQVGSVMTQDWWVAHQRSVQHMHAIENERDEMKRLLEQVKEQTQQQRIVAQRLRDGIEHGRVSHTKALNDLTTHTALYEHLESNMEVVKSDQASLETQLANMSNRIIAHADEVRLGQRCEHLLLTLQRSQTAASSRARHVEDGKEYTRRLELLLEEEAQKWMALEAENDALRQLIAEGVAH